MSRHRFSTYDQYKTRAPDDDQPYPEEEPVTVKSFMEWVYVTEAQQEDKEWVVIGQYDSPEEAIKHATEEKRKSRVRQFKTTVFREEHEQVPAGVQSVGVPVPTVSFFCPSHPHKTALAFATSRPRCPDCRQEMFEGDGQAPIKDLTK